ncbi:hypothetical protein BBP40_000339 [Aspergillus hancockii]|nr:hypothetical protein BBP40_000339 [Aspergillus hancockii]
MQIIRLQKDSVSTQHVLSVQNVRILEDLAAVVMQAEQRMILGDSTPTSIDRSKDSGKRTSKLDTPNHSEAQDSVRSGTSYIPPMTQASLNPLQEVFGHHTQYQTLQRAVSAPEAIDATWPDPLELNQGLPALDSAGFSWDGNISTLAESGLADASQLWLWSDNLGYQTYAELSDTLH